MTTTYEFFNHIFDYYIWYQYQQQYFRTFDGFIAGRSSFLVPLPRASENGSVSENHIQNARWPKPFSVHPMPSKDFSQQKQVLESILSPFILFSPDI